MLQICPKCKQLMEEDIKICPHCHGKGTADISYPSLTCQKCGGKMEAGVMVPGIAPLPDATLSGIYFSKGKAGMRVPLKAFLCPKCGYVEMYRK